MYNIFIRKKNILYILQNCSLLRQFETLQPLDLMIKWSKGGALCLKNYMR